MRGRPTWKIILGILWAIWGIFLGLMFLGCALTPTPHEASQSNEPSWIPGDNPVNDGLTAGEQGILENVQGWIQQFQGDVKDIAAGRDVGTACGDIQAGVDILGEPLAPSDRFKPANDTWYAALREYASGENLAMEGKSAEAARAFDDAHQKAMDAVQQMKGFMHQ